jgi:glutamate N-acetyltransferase/amino-acid N-acetyltransferase
MALVHALSETLSCESSQVLIASTGVIGVPLEVDKITRALPELVERQTDVAEHFALAIMTTDLVPKTYATEVKLSTGTVRLAGIAKGSGMIHPNMATMLGYILTDAQMPVAAVQSLLKSAVNESFNMISVDGDSSTNDAVFMLANGASGVSIMHQSDMDRMQQAVTLVAQALAKSIARDGEGASKLLEVQVSGLDSLELTRAAARAVTTSPLVKTAVHGADPNWGRIMAKIGALGVPAECLSQANLALQGVAVLQGGSPVSFDREHLRKLLQAEHIVIDIKLGHGSQSATAWGCDLSKKYVEINTDYTT